MIKLQTLIPLNMFQLQGFTEKINPLKVFNLMLNPFPDIFATVNETFFKNNLLLNSNFLNKC